MFHPHLFLSESRSCQIDKTSPSSIRTKIRKALLRLIPTRYTSLLLAIFATFHLESKVNFLLKKHKKTTRNNVFCCQNPQFVL